MNDTIPIDVLSKKSYERISHYFQIFTFCSFLNEKKKNTKNQIINKKPKNLFADTIF